MFIGCSPSEIFMKQANSSNFFFDEAHGHAMRLVNKDTVVVIKGV